MQEMERRKIAREVAAFETVETPQRQRKWPQTVLTGLAILLVGSAIGWSAATVLTPPDDVLDSTSYTYVEVADGEVGSSFNLNTVATWEAVTVGSNQASGVVTSVNVSQGEEVKQGAVLYTVNLRPVVIARGVVPAFRPLAVGASGADVAQLQTFLTDRGYYQSAADGLFGWLTDRAVRAWQKAMGLEQDGIIQQGDLIFVPSLPSRVSLDTDVIVRGEAVSGGEAVVKGLPPEPTFSVPVTEVQARQMPLGTRVEITGPEDELWEAFIVDQVPSADGATVTAVLQGLEGGSICGDACDQIPVSDGSLLRSRIVTVESVSGLVVPTAALRSDPSGGITVIDDEGVVHDVSIVASAKGMAVITGVERGTVVRVPADEG